MLKSKKRKFSLRKVAKKLVSVSVGIIVSFIIEGHRNTVKANEIKNPSEDNEITELTNKVTKFGKIIPVTQNKEPIVNAPTPRYLHDPNDPTKAIATPVPVIENYVLSKNNQAANVDYRTKMVIPPLDPQQNTKVVYVHQDSVNATTEIIDSGEQKLNYNSSYYENNYYIGSQTLSVAQSTGDNLNENSKNKWNNDSNEVVLGSNTLQTESMDGNSNVMPAINEDPKDSSNIVESTTISGSEIDATSDLESSNSSSPSTGSLGNENSDQKNDKEVKEKRKRDALDKNKELERKQLRNDREIMGKERKSNKKKNKKRSFLSRILPDVIMNQETKLPAIPSHASLKIKDIVENKELKKIVVEGTVGKPIIFEELSELINNYEDKGYQVIKIRNADSKKKILLNKKDPFGFFGEEEKNFVLDLGHQLSPINPVNIPADIRPQLVKKKVLLLINYRGAGEETPMNDLQVAFLTRTLTYDHVTKTLNINGKYSTDWKPTPEYYKEVVSPEVPGYVAEPSVVPALPVEMQDTVKIVNYVPIADEKNKVIGSLTKVLKDLQGKKADKDKVKKQEEKKRQAELKKQEEKKRQAELKKQEEKKRQAELKKQEEKKRQAELKKQEEKKRQAELKKQEEKKRQAELKKQEEKKRQAELKKQEEKKRQVELKKQEEKKRQAELKKQEEKKRQAELKKQEEKKRQVELKKQEEKKRQAELKKQKEKKRQAELKKQEEKKRQAELKKQEEKKHSKGITERRYFVDQTGKILQPDKRMPSDEKFPVIDHYILDSKNNVANGVIGVYKKLGKIIPVDIYGNLIPNPDTPTSAVASQYFANDKEDPTQALANQKVPEISGYTPLTAKVTPANPEVDIPVVYEKEKIK